MVGAGFRSRQAVEAMGRPENVGEFAGVAQLVEREPSKLDVAGSSPVSRSADCGNGKWGSGDWGN
jgi:hypothetical protein